MNQRKTCLFKLAPSPHSAVSHDCMTRWLSNRGTHSAAMSSPSRRETVWPTMTATMTATDQTAEDILPATVPHPLKCRTDCCPPWLSKRFNTFSSNVQSIKEKDRQCSPPWFHNRPNSRTHHAAVSHFKVQDRLLPAVTPWLSKQWNTFSSKVQSFKEKDSVVWFGSTGDQTAEDTLPQCPIQTAWLWLSKQWNTFSSKVQSFKK